MGQWQLQEAKARFSQMIRLAQDEPQLITVHGQETAVVLSKAEYDRLTRQKPLLTTVMQSVPIGDDEIDGDIIADSWIRDRSLPRKDEPL